MGHLKCDARFLSLDRNPVRFDSIMIYRICKVNVFLRGNTDISGRGRVRVHASPVIVVIVDDAFPSMMGICTEY